MEPNPQKADGKADGKTDGKASAGWEVRASIDGGCKSGNGQALKAYSIGAEVPEDTRRLHLNEFRFTHPHSVIEAAKNAYGSPEALLLTQYPPGESHPTMKRLLRVLAEYVSGGVSPTSSASEDVSSSCTPQNVAAAAGSDEILRAVIDTCGVRGHKRILMVVPGYTHFEHYVRLRGLEIVPLPTVGPTMALSPEEQGACLRYHRELLAEGCLVYLCSPNNPTGDIWKTDVLEEAAARYPKSLFLVDEAYIEFASVDSSADDDFSAAGSLTVISHSKTTFEGDGEAGRRQAAQMMNKLSAAAIALKLPNVLVARTLSKAFGLAALRIGYAVGQAATIEGLKLAISPKALGLAAAAIACAALAEAEHYAVRAGIARANARRLLAWMRAAGRVCFDGRGNYILVHTGDATAEVVKTLAAAGVQVRDRGDLPGLSGFVRVTVGSVSDAAAVEQAFARLPLPAQAPIQLLYTPKGKIAAIKEMLKTVVRVLDANCVESWAQGGTMLGAARCGGILPHDDDADLAYCTSAPESGGDPVAGLAKAFAAEGLTLQRNRTDAYWQIGTNAPNSTISPIHIDLFSYSLVGEKWALGDPRFRDEAPESAGAHCNTRYAPDELFPLRKTKFYDFELRMPNKSEQVLDRALGAGWLTTARVRTADANANGGADAAHVVYRIADRMPA